MTGHIPPVSMPRTRGVVTSPMEAFCPYGHGTVHLRPGEFWPAFCCECGEQLRETGISREFREREDERSKYLCIFEHSITESDVEFMAEMGVAL